MKSHLAYYQNKCLDIISRSYKYILPALRTRQSLDASIAESILLLYSNELNWTTEQIRNQLGRGKVFLYIPDGIKTSDFYKCFWGLALINEIFNISEIFAAVGSNEFHVVYPFQCIKHRWFNVTKLNDLYEIIKLSKPTMILHYRSLIDIYSNLRSKYQPNPKIVIYDPDLVRALEEYYQDVMCDQIIILEKKYQISKVKQIIEKFGAKFPLIVGYKKYKLFYPQIIVKNASVELYNLQHDNIWGWGLFVGYNFEKIILE